MKALILALSFSWLNFAAAVEPAPTDCGPELDSLSAPPASTQAALERLERAAADYAGQFRDRGSILGHIRTTPARVRIALAARSIIKGDLSSPEKAAACEAFKVVALRTRLIWWRARTALKLTSALCAETPTTVRELTEDALKLVREKGTYIYLDLLDEPRGKWGQRPRKQVRRWLNGVIDGHHISPETWRTLVTTLEPKALLPLVDAAHGDFARLGLNDADLTALAGRLVAVDVPLRIVRRWIGLSHHASAELESELGPVQWVDHLYHSGRLSEAALGQLADRPVPRVENPLISPTILLEQLLADPQLPFELFERIFTELNQIWPRAFGKFARLQMVYRDNAKTKTHLERAERFFGRTEVRPRAVWREARSFAANATKDMATAHLSTADEFIRAFDLKRVDLNQPPLDHDDERRMRERALAEAYFAVLRKRLPEFFALNPTAAHARWILETPLQFKADLHNEWLHWGRGRFSPKRLLKHRVGYFGTARDVFAVLETTIARAMPMVRTGADWFELVTFQVREAFEYEQLKRVAMNDHLDLAMRVGDGRLDWLDYPILENGRELGYIGVHNQLSWFRQLYGLRESVPANVRADETLTKRAVELILGSELLHASQDELDQHLNHSLLHVIRGLVTPDGMGREVNASPEVVAKWVHHLRKGLLRYLVARGEAGASIVVTMGELIELKALSAPLGFKVSLIRETPSREAQIRFTPRAR